MFGNSSEELPVFWRCWGRWGSFETTLGSQSSVMTSNWKIRKALCKVRYRIGALWLGSIDLLFFCRGRFRVRRDSVVRFRGIIILIITILIVKLCCLHGHYRTICTSWTAQKNPVHVRVYHIVRIRVLLTTASFCTICCRVVRITGAKASSSSRGPATALTFCATTALPTLP